MHKLLTSFLLIAPIVVAEAMPTKAQLAKVQPLVNELMVPKVKELREGKIKDLEVADAAVSFAEEASGEASKYLFLKGAIFHYVRAGEYDKAAEAVDLICKAVKGMDESAVLDVLPKSVAGLAPEKGGRLAEMYAMTRNRLEAKKDLPRLEKEAKRGDRDVKRQYADALAASGDWPKALEQYKKLAREFAKEAAAELAGTAKPLAAGDYWWGYKPLYTNARDTFKMRAVEFYSQALTAGEVKGLKRNLIEQRIASLGTSAGPVSPNTLQNKDLDLGEGVTLKLIACPAGSFEMGKGKAGEGQIAKHKVIITRPFLLGAYPLTEDQAARLGGPRDWAKSPRAARPSTHADRLALIARLNAQFMEELPKGYVFRLPTEAELVYAMTSGGKEPMDKNVIGIYGPDKAMKMMARDKYGWKEGNYTVDMRPTAVGLAKPNKWGFYDIAGNSSPFVLDIVAKDSPLRKPVFDEKGGLVSLAYGQTETDPLCWDKDLPNNHPLCISQSNLHSRGLGKWDYDFFCGTFRICLGPDLVTEKLAAGQK